jgi:hypothetical protein
MEVEEIGDILNADYFPTKFNKQDLTKIGAFNRWLETKKNQGKKIVKCPICWSYEVYVSSEIHVCPNCGEEYCQVCLKKYVEGEREHDHESSCCDKFCDLVKLIFDYGGSDDWEEPSEYIRTGLLFLFGTPTLFAIKYFNFFRKHYVIDNCCVHWFFTILNLIANICYSIIYSIWYMEVSFIILSPSIIYYKFFKIVIDNWIYVAYVYDVGNCPITELTVSGTGYGYGY